MKNCRRLTLVALLAFLISSTYSTASTDVEEREFLNSYQLAFDSKSTAALKYLLYTKGVDDGYMRAYLEMWKTVASEGGILLIKLENLSSDDSKRIARGTFLISGVPARLPLKPYKKMIVRVGQELPGGGAHYSDEEIIVSEYNGNIVIPLPVRISNH